MNDVSIAGEGRVRIASLTVLNDEGVTDCIGLQIESNADDGWVVLSNDRALDLAAKLMAFVGGWNDQA